ncbi:MAG TPA: TolC family protein [Gemmatimonadales bacterium]|nr:TolC family protein [Gemmatimonadales bacterium]
MNSSRLLLLWTLGSAVPAGLAAQQLTLADALARAAATGYPNRAARAQASAEHARTLGALQGMLPTLRVEGGWVRTTDPLAAFGSLLRQRAVTLAAFDPASLNDPAARSNWNAGLVAEVPLFNADAWAGRSAARAGARAAAATADWTAATTRLQVVQAYYGARLASEVVLTLEVAEAMAAAHVTQANSKLEQGMVTRSDLLLAQLRADDIRAQLIGARAQAGLARRQLALVLGAPTDTAFALSDSLPSPERIRGVAELLAPVALAGRADVAAAKAAAEAAGRDVLRATGRLLPRLSAFGRYDWNDRTAPFHGERSWTVGVMASWTLFSGFSEIGDVRGARARATAARAMAEAAEGQAALEVSSRESDVTVALARLTIAEQAVDQASEAHRLVSRQYVGGLAGITELLGAQATETQTRLGLAQARVALITALAARQLARGSDPAALTALEE